MEYNSGNPFYSEENMVVKKIRYILPTGYTYYMDQQGNCNFTRGYYPCEFSALACMSQWHKNLTFIGTKFDRASKQIVNDLFGCNYFHIYTASQSLVATDINTPLWTSSSPDYNLAYMPSVYYNYRQYQALDPSWFKLPIDPSNCVELHPHSETNYFGEQYIPAALP